MKTFFYNIGYFFKEIRKIIRINPVSNLFSVIGTGLILFLLGIVIAGWTIGNQLILSLQKEAEINAYFNKGTTKIEALKIVDTINQMDGVWKARYVGREEAKQNMKELLGEEADILKLFKENPFEAYIEVNIKLDSVKHITASIKNIKGIEYVRDNRKILELIRKITQDMKLIGLFIAAAVGITTVIIISHMIRQGIYNNREQINTLRLLGAPNSFIGFPFVMAGLVMTLCGGMIAYLMLTIMIKEGYTMMSGNIPFIPLPPRTKMLYNAGELIFLISIFLGSLGSMFGLLSIKKNRS